MTKVEQLARYQSRHVIAPYQDADEPYWCKVDRLPVIPRQGGGWRHDPTAVDRVYNAAVRERLEQGTAYVSERHDDGLGHAKAERERQEWTAHLDWHGHTIDVEVVD